MEKYIVKTDALKGFHVNDIVEKFNEHQYGKEGSLAGDRCISKDTIKRNPEWFIEINERKDFFKELLNKWDNGASIWSIEMGGMGPGYEQAIQVLFVETLRNLIDKKPNFEDKSKEDYETAKDARKKALETLEVKWGYSGAQVGAATNLAYQFWIKTPYTVLRDKEVEDRKIQVSNNLEFKG